MGLGSKLLEDEENELHGFSVDSILNNFEETRRVVSLEDADDEDMKAKTTRRLFMASALMAAGAGLSMPSTENGFLFDLTAAQAAKSPNGELRFVSSPVNKRSGVTVFDAEKSGYNVQFITYLSRFLLGFDGDCQRWWFARAADIPRMATSGEVDKMRFMQFAAFSASVEVGLQEYQLPDGPERLMRSLLQRYCPDMTTLSQYREAQGLPPMTEAAEAKEMREIQEARRQIALLFGLMKTYQPVDELTKLLAAIDNGSITSVIVNDPGSGYAPGYGPPMVRFPPPAAGDSFKTATGRAILRPNGKILRLDLVNRGLGYTKPPTVEISPPALTMKTEDPKLAVTATAKTFIFKKGLNKGRIERIQLINPGAGYAANETIRVKLSLPDIPLSDGAVRATATAIPELEVGSIEIVDGGTGYAVERPLDVFIDAPPITARVNMNDPMMAGIIAPDKPLPPTTITPSRREISSKRMARIEQDAGIGGGGGCIGRACYDRRVEAVSFAKAERNSYASFRNDEDATKAEKIESAVKRRSVKSLPVSPVISATTSAEDNAPPSLPVWAGGPSSSSGLLYLLPSGVGLEYDATLSRYTLTTEEDFNNFFNGLSTKPLDPEFGPRGRSPIERFKTLDIATLLRFCLSGAVCCSSAHLALTPIDVVKTKVQTNPSKYPGVFEAMKTVSSEEGMGAFFNGWAPTFLGFFVNGGITYTATEFFRRYFTDFLGADSTSNEVPIILAAASVAAFIGSFTIAPFEAVRIRSVAQPDYADSALGVLTRLIKEEGVGTFFSAVPAFLLKEIPFACGKFTVFDLSTEWMYDTFPAAREDLSLSLLVSLVGGTLGGICAAIISNPADATISEMKKGKTNVGPAGAAAILLERGGAASMFKGLGLRMFFYSLIVSLQFLIYDAIRYALGIGADDLTLYLDVLGGALRESGGPV